MHRSHQHARRGFTLAEVLIASFLLTLVMTGVMTFFVTSSRLWQRNTQTMVASLRTGSAMSLLVHGLNNTNSGLRAAQRTTIWRWTDGDSWTIGFNSNRWVAYSGVSNTLSDSIQGLLCRNVVWSTATVSTAGCDLSFRVVEGVGPYTVTNQLITFVAFRN